MSQNNKSSLKMVWKILYLEWSGGRVIWGGGGGGWSEGRVIWGEGDLGGGWSIKQCYKKLINETTAYLQGMQIHMFNYKKGEKD